MDLPILPLWLLELPFVLAVVFAILRCELHPKSSGHER